MNEKIISYIRKIVVTGALGALAAFLGATRLGFWPWFTGASLTVMHIPAIIGAILEGPVVGLGIGAIFGIFSLIQANLNPVGFDAFLRNPLVSVLPRILFPFAAWGLYKLMGKKYRLPAIAFAAVVASLVHTALVLSMLVLTNGSGIFTEGDATKSIWTVLGTIVVANGVPEAIMAGVLTTLTAAAVAGIAGKRQKSRLAEEDTDSINNPDA